MAFEISSPAFSQGGSIPVQYTCDGDDLSPPLQWSGVPAGTRSLALIVDDPDAPDPVDLPSGTQQGVNDWKRTGYGGPCPPIGRHRYFFKLYALDGVLPADGPLTKAQLLQAMQGHVLDEAELMGGYQRP